MYLIIYNEIKLNFYVTKCSFIFISEVSHNDSCPDLPEIQNGWKTTSHTALVRGTHITYQCDPGYDLVGRETLICQLDLSWSTQPPFCEKSELSTSQSRAVKVQYSNFLFFYIQLILGITFHHIHFQRIRNNWTVGCLIISWPAVYSFTGNSFTRDQTNGLPYLSNIQLD